MGLKQLTGYCDFCNQARLVSVSGNREWTEDELNRIATDECECARAKEQRERDEKLKRAELYINNLVTDDHEDIKHLLIEVVPLLLDHKLKKCTVNIDGAVTYTVFRGNDDAVIAQRTQKIVKEEEIE